MKRTLWVLVLMGSVLLSVSPVLADGDFYVVVGGGGVGTKITSLPYSINDPGFYYLTGNLGVSGGTAIFVNASNVTLDLMGFSLTNTGTPGYTYGISLTMQQNVEIRNGVIQNFSIGIDEGSGAGTNDRVINVRTIGNKRTGINLFGFGHLVQNCTSSFNGENGIWIEGGTIRGCTANQNGLTGITVNGPGNVINNLSAVNKLGFSLGGDTAKVIDGNSASNNITNYSADFPSYVWGLNAGR